MAVALRGTPTTNSSTTTTSFALNYVTGQQVGDLLIAQFNVNTGTGTTVTATGWTAIPVYTPQTQNNTVLQVLMYRFVTGSEGASVTFTLSNSRIVSGAIAAYSGVDNSNPWAGIAQSTATTSNTVTFPAATMQSDSVYALALVCTRNTTGTDTITAASSGYTVSADVSYTGGASFSQTVFQDSHTVYALPVTTAVTPGNATVGPTIANQCKVTLLLRASIAGVTTPTIDFVAGATNGSTTFTSSAITTGYANEFVLVAISTTAAPTVTSVTDTAGNTYTRAGISAPSRQTDVWYTLAASPMSGNVITFVGPTSNANTIQVITFAGVDISSSSAALGNVTQTSGTSALDQASVTTTRNNSRVASFSIANSNTTPTAAASNTFIHSGIVGTSEGIATISTAAVATSGTSFTAGIATPASTSFAIVAIEIKAPVVLVTASGATLMMMGV